MSPHGTAVALFYILVVLLSNSAEQRLFGEVSFNMLIWYWNDAATVMMVRVIIRIQIDLIGLKEYI